MLRCRKSCKLSQVRNGQERKIGLDEVRKGNERLGDASKKKS